MAANDRADASDRPNPRVSLRALRAFALSAPLIALAMLALVLRALLVEKPPAPLPIVPPPQPPLTSHLALFVLDGLRYDYATDPAKAPNLARRMAEGASAQVVAGQVTMTSAAVLSFGTGSRGDFAQILTNLSPSRTRQNDLFANARAGGLRTALIGDRTWLDAFGEEGFTDVHTDAAGLALDVDNSPEMFDEARKRLLSSEPPALTVVHFLATDHFGHAFGTRDSRYLEMLRAFDERLERLLSQLPASVTAIVLSDHGATDTGAHGSDIWSVRQTPLFAMGPGIRSAQSARRGLVFDQVDVAPTLATLLGVPVPAESRGTVATELLDLDDERTQAIQAAERRRVAPALDLRAGGRGAAAIQGGEAEAGEAAVRAYDRALAEAKESRGLSVSLALLTLLSLGLLGAGLALPDLLPTTRPLGMRWGAALFGVAVASVLLTKYVEVVVPPFHNVIRGVLFAAGNAALLTWAVRPALVSRIAARRPVLFFAIAMGALAFSYTANTQPEAFVAAAAFMLAALAASRRWAVAVLAALLFLALHRFGYVNEDPFPAWLAARPAWLAVTSWGALFAYLLATPLAVEVPLARRLAWAVAPALALFGATHATPTVGVGATLALPAAALLAFLRGERLGARNLVLAGFLLLSRDVEVAPLLALGALAELSPVVLAQVSARGASRPLRAAALVLVLFGLGFLARVVIQRGLDFDRMHFGAGAFGSPEPNKLWVGVMMGYRYAIALLWLYGSALARLSARDRALVTYGSLVAWLGRAGTLATMLIVARSSYWTALRTLSDVGPALIQAALLGIALLVVVRRGVVGAPLAQPRAGRGDGM